MVVLDTWRANRHWIIHTMCNVVVGPDGRMDNGAHHHSIHHCVQSIYRRSALSDPHHRWQGIVRGHARDRVLRLLHGATNAATSAGGCLCLVLRVRVDDLGAPVHRQGVGPNRARTFDFLLCDGSGELGNLAMPSSSNKMDTTMDWTVVDSVIHPRIWAHCHIDVMLIIQRPLARTCPTLLSKLMREQKWPNL
jgi:hypothetical protein